MDRKITPSKWRPKRVLTLTLGAVLLVGILYQLFLRDHSSRLKVRREKLTIFTVKKGDFQEYIPVSGTIIPLQTVYLDAIEGGRVTRKFIEAGSMVKQNDTILVLENTDLLMNIMRREADLAEQSNHLRDTRLKIEQQRLALKLKLVKIDYQVKRLRKLHRRHKALVEKELIAPETFETIEDEYQYYLQRKTLARESYQQDSLFRKEQILQLTASLARMKQNLALMKQKLNNLILKAPIQGQLTALNAEIGELKSPGERLGQVDVLDSFKVRISVDEYYLARIEIGLTGEFDFSGKSYQLISRKVFPEIREGRFDVDLKFIGAQPKGIRRGQTVHLRLELGAASEALLLRRGGFYQNSGGNWVYTLSDSSSNVAVKRAIRLGRQNPQMFEVLEGLTPGDRVIISSYDNFGNADKLILQ